MNWYKLAWTPGGSTPIMDDYSQKRHLLPSVDHRKDDKSLVNANPILGGDSRDGYPDEAKPFDEKPSDEFKNRRRLPGESVLMDQDPPTGEGVNKNQFVDPGDRTPMGLTNNSVRLDRGLPPIRDVYKRFREKAKLKAINRI